MVTIISVSLNPKFLYIIFIFRVLSLPDQNTANFIPYRSYKSNKPSSDYKRPPYSRKKNCFYDK